VASSEHTDDGLEAMRDRDKGRARELFAERLLYELVCMVVDRSRRLVEEENLALLEEGPREANELLLAL
jgi:hypothetical protein